MLIAIFISLIAVSLALAAYAALGVTVIEAVLLGLGLFAVLGLLNEMLSRRAGLRQMDKKLEDLTRLVARENEAHHHLQERIKLISALEAGPRLDSLEADQAVFGTVVRQVAESVKELEENLAFQGDRPVSQTVPEIPSDVTARIETPQTEPEPQTPFIPPHMLLDAIKAGQIEALAIDIVTLPQRKLFAHRLMPQLKMEDDDIVGPDQFLQYQTEIEIIASVDFALTRRALEYLRRGGEDQSPGKMVVPLTVNDLAHDTHYNEFMSYLASNAAFAPYVVFEVDYTQFIEMEKDDRQVLDNIVSMGYRLSLVGFDELRLDFRDLMDRGVRYIGVDADAILSTPPMSDIHAADLADYLARFDMDLFVINVTGESQILELLELEVKFASGGYINAPRLLTSGQ